MAHLRIVNFYAWEPRYLPLLLGSALVNYSFGLSLSVIVHSKKRRLLLAVAVAINLGFLAYYKYAGFLIENLAALTALKPPPPILRLAISFFTFQQIAYLADVANNRKAEQSLSKYLLFVTFFPQLIAGPIVHHKEMIPQFTPAPYKYLRLIYPALTLIILGLSKKVLLADTLALFVDPVFDALLRISISLSEAWIAAVGYTMQLYFDFSGYCDIAMGSTLLSAYAFPLIFILR